jgi:hypothetical protein
LDVRRRRGRRRRNKRITAETQRRRGYEGKEAMLLFVSLRAVCALCSEKKVVGKKHQKPRDSNPWETTQSFHVSG